MDVHGLGTIAELGDAPKQMLPQRQIWRAVGVIVVVALTMATVGWVIHNNYVNNFENSPTVVPVHLDAHLADDLLARSQAAKDI